MKSKGMNPKAPITMLMSPKKGRIATLRGENGELLAFWVSELPFKHFIHWLQINPHKSMRLLEVRPQGKVEEDTLVF